jgi:uracil-DNA glycosylase
MQIEPFIDASWMKELSLELSKNYIKELKDFLLSEQSKNKIIYPPSNNIFSSLQLTPLNKVKVVIIGQDPYHGKGQANGLAFSVDKDITIPPSLKNIFKEIKSDLKQQPPENGDLAFWANQGVLLLNTVFTVEEGRPDSHSGIGWEKLTDKIISILNTKKKIVFLLWGAKALKKGLNIDRNKHKVFYAPHPSPLSAYKGFFGCKHFSKTNLYLKNQGLEPIRWTQKE